MASKQEKFIMIGLPETGKTTFLAALWYVVNNSDEVPTALRLKALQGDDGHLNRVRGKWLNYLRVDRTSPSSEELVSMELTRADRRESVQLFFPDVSGERFRQQIEDRQCRKDYVVQVREALGALFFIHSGKINRPNRIDEAESLAQIIRNGVNNQECLAVDNSIPWQPSFTPTQVKLVDLLQILTGVPNIRKPYHLVIIFSAWDLVLGIENSPKVFLEKRLPLLDQYLKANSELLHTKVYGISAQGGRLDDEASRRRLAEQNQRPSERIIVRSEDIDSHDITEPIKWLMGCAYEN
ncbi:MAG TPA: hypothetical protein VMW72_12745 [Sedimentisphaerales bacterium]|nr:hypothetical protein [Sedimentisphaerales bacterium]